MIGVVLPFEDSTATLVVVFLMMFLIFMRYYTKVRLYNLFACGLIFYLIYAYVDRWGIVISLAGMFLWLLYDTFFGEI